MKLKLFLIAVFATWTAFCLDGQVQAGHSAIVGSTVTLWSAGEDAPKQIGHTQTDSRGLFRINAPAQADKGRIYYVLVQGGRSVHDQNHGENHNIAMLALLGSQLPSRVVINELTTIASIYTAAQFIEGLSIRGNALGLHIAAINVPNFVNLQTGELGSVRSNSVNGMQTTTLSRFCTLGDLLSGCVMRVRSDASQLLYQQTTYAGSQKPGNTLEAFHSMATHTWENTEKHI